MNVRKSLTLVIYLVFSILGFGQTCTLIDSINTTVFNNFNSFFHPVGISYDGTGLWVSGSTIDYNRIYKYDLSGNRVDSVEYNSNWQPIEAIQYDNGFLYAAQYLVDTLYKIDIATSAVVDKFSLGMSPNVEEVIDFAMQGDTLYFVSGGTNINRFKFVKSTGQLINLGTGNYSSTGIDFWDGHLFSSSWFPTWMQGCTMNPNDLLADINSAQPSWCVPKSLALTNDGNYFYQTSWDTKYIYILSNDNLGFVEPSATNINIYPIPANNTLVIENAPNFSDFTILNLQGAVVFNGVVASSKHHVDLSLSSGFYWIQIKNGSEMINEKIVVE